MLYDAIDPDNQLEYLLTPLIPFLSSAYIIHVYRRSPNIMVLLASRENQYQKNYHCRYMRTMLYGDDNDIAGRHSTLTIRGPTLTMMLSGSRPCPFSSRT